MKILIACEESQTVCKAFRKLGHEAYSCDMKECSGGKPEWHIKGDVREVLNQEWDMIIAFPTCTYICNSGVCHLHTDKSRWAKLDKACEFFNLFLNHPCKRIAIENPVPHKYAIERFYQNRKYSQTVQPYHFGHPESKRTCFWLKGLPNLVHTDDVKHIYDTLPKKEAQRIHYLSPGPERAALRSKTFQGIGDAMASQWSKVSSYQATLF